MRANDSFLRSIRGTSGVPASTWRSPEGAASRRHRFFTCGARAHPSAAPTGLAVLGCVSPLVDWLPASGPIVATPGGAVHVPRLHAAAYGRVDVEYPEIIVTISPA